MTTATTPEEEFAVNQAFLEHIRKGVMIQCVVAAVEGADVADAAAFDRDVLDRVVAMSPPDAFGRMMVRSLAAMELADLRRGEPPFEERVAGARARFEEMSPDSRRSFLFAYGGGEGTA